MSTTLVARGVFRPDGLIELLEPVEFPNEPLEVTVTLTEPFAIERSLMPVAACAERTPSGLWLDESVVAPLDLPRPSGNTVSVIPGGERLPNTLFLEVEGSA